MLIIWLLITALSLFVSEPIIELLSNDQYHLLHCTSIIFHNNLVAPFQGEISEDILTVTDVIIIITWFVWLSGITPRKAPKIIKKSKESLFALGNSLSEILSWTLNYTLQLGTIDIKFSHICHILKYLSHSSIFVIHFPGMLSRAGQVEISDTDCNSLTHSIPFDWYSSDSSNGNTKSYTSVWERAAVAIPLLLLFQPWPPASVKAFESQNQ